MGIVRTISANVLGKTEVAFDYHAVKRMKERGITEAQVIETLQNPNVTGLRADLGRQRVRRHYGSHYSVDVVYENQPARIVVITATRSSTPAIRVRRS